MLEKKSQDKLKEFWLVNCLSASETRCCSIDSIPFYIIARALFLLALLLVFYLIFFTLGIVVFNCAGNLIEEHELFLLFETVYQHSQCKTLLCLGFW